MSGLLLVIRNHSSNAITLDRGVYVSPGFVTNIGVIRTFRTPGKCVADLTPTSNYSKVIFDYFSDLNLTRYDQKFCIVMCFQDNLADICGCTSLDSPKPIKGTKFCQNEVEIACENNYYNYFYASNIDDACENVCGQNCGVAQYDLIISSAQYSGWNAYSNIFNQSARSSFHEISAQTPTVRVNVNYYRMVYQVISQPLAMSFDSFLGSIGGQLGLFLGISFLSFIELVELALDLIFLRIKHSSFFGKQKPAQPAN
jgi:hypothetical protein